MSDRLTDAAMQAVGIAVNKAYLAATAKDPARLARAVNGLADGLFAFTMGLPWPERTDAFLAIGKVLLLRATPVVVFALT
jgi:hypothetical protein